MPETGIETEASPAQEEMSEEEAIRKIAEAMAASGGTLTPEEKHNVFTFLHNVAVAKDTTKTGYLRDDEKLNEMGIPKLPVRSYHSLALIASDIMGNELFRNYFLREAEIVTKTSLAREGKLLSLAVLQKREIADTTRKKMKKKKGWFTPKETPEEKEEGLTTVAR